MEQPQEKRFITWGEIDIVTEKVAELVKASGKEYEDIFAVPRGGFIPAVILSHHLNIPIITELDQVSGTTLVVDDIMDSGKTMSELVTTLEVNYAMDPDVAVLYIRKTIDRGGNPAYCGEGVETNDWLVFPWETEESSKYDNTKIV